MNHFLSCDWGTTSFRLRLVSVPGLKTIAEVKSEEGIAAIHNLWKEKNADEKRRLNFYLSILNERLKTLQQKTNVSTNLPIIISGMASSTIGMIELPYKQLPIHLNGSDLIVEKIKSREDFPNDIFLISGLRTENDVMRGEETQLIGSADKHTEGLFIFPGTHSKHVLVKNGMAVDIKTYMTGEFFELLSTKSILAASVEKSDAGSEKIVNAFKTGVEESSKYNLLHNSFLVRTNLLFNRYTKQENYYCLSGLLIGSELQEVKKLNEQSIFLVGAKQLVDFYATALDCLQIKASIKIIDAEEATIKGQYKVYESVVEK
jgi:2-dehydro-3-deoxygalactonokinase